MARNKYDVDEILEESFDFDQFKRLMAYLKPYRKRFFSVAVMMLMALSFIFGPLRSVPMGVRVVTGISFGFVFYVLDQIFGPLTLVYGIPPIIGALLPSASFFLISLWLLMRKS